MSKNDTLVSLISHVNWSAGWKLLTSTSVLVRLAELVLTLNNFSFDGEHYQQISGVAMGTKMGPNCANLFVGFVEKQIFEQYTDPMVITLDQVITLVGT